MLIATNDQYSSKAYEGKANCVSLLSPPPLPPSEVTNTNNPMCTHPLFSFFLIHDTSTNIYKDISERFLVKYFLLKLHDICFKLFICLIYLFLFFKTNTGCQRFECEEKGISENEE